MEGGKPKQQGCMVEIYPLDLGSIVPSICCGALLLFPTTALPLLSCQADQPGWVRHTEEPAERRSRAILHLLPPPFLGPPGRARFLPQTC